jgi:hypothetical protein
MTRFSTSTPPVMKYTWWSTYNNASNRSARKGGRASRGDRASAVIALGSSTVITRKETYKQALDVQLIVLVNAGGMAPLFSGFSGLCVRIHHHIRKETIQQDNILHSHRTESRECRRNGLPVFMFVMGLSISIHHIREEPIL